MRNSYPPRLAKYLNFCQNPGLRKNLWYDVSGFIAVCILKLLCPVTPKRAELADVKFKLGKLCAGRRIPRAAGVLTAIGVTLGGNDIFDILIGIPLVVDASDMLDIDVGNLAALDIGKLLTDENDV